MKYVLETIVLCWGMALTQYIFDKLYIKNSYLDFNRYLRKKRSVIEGSHFYLWFWFSFTWLIRELLFRWPNGLTLDLVKKRLYWVDAKLNTISVCNWDGSNRKLVLFSASTLRHPFSITTFEDWLYWTDWDRAAVFRANKFTGKDLAPITATEMVQVTFPDFFTFRTSQKIFAESNGNSRVSSVSPTWCRKPLPAS